MRRFFLITMVLMLSGCASVSIPNYIYDEHPYKRTVYAPFDKARDATAQTFEEFGWMVEKESNPSLFEREKVGEEGKRQTLILTEVRQSYFFLGSRYSRVNAYLREIADKETEIEIRYLRVTSILFKSFYHYTNDKMVERIFNHIEQKLLSL